MTMASPILALILTIAGNSNPNAPKSRACDVRPVEETWEETCGHDNTLHNVASCRMLQGGGGNEIPGGGLKSCDRP